MLSAVGGFEPPSRPPYTTALPVASCRIEAQHRVVLDAEEAGELVTLLLRTIIRLVDVLLHHDL